MPHACIDDPLVEDMYLSLYPQIKLEAGFGKTHPPPGDRIKDLQALTKDAKSPAAPAAQLARFKKAMADV